MTKWGFRSLKVWERAKNLSVRIYRLTEEGCLARDFGLKDQMRRASVSVCSNIAEGDERDSDRDSARFFNIAKGSLAELSTQIEIAAEIGYLDRDSWVVLDQECTEIGRMLGSLIRKRQAPAAKPNPAPIA